ncbi:DOMON-like domain-containing protein [Phenylobacterium sp.]|uniref:DOMON-like domain-containing protein n=1 Tax=Phenylobacterium sp. TaxID=1871053 RepID=UPI00356AA227
MRTILTLHPGGRCAAVTAIEVEAARLDGGRLALRYIVTGDAAGIVLPAPSPPTRTGGLWRHTCFEAFVGVPSGEPYYEFNLAPSTEWAAYRFDGYRQGMAPIEPCEAPAIAMSTTRRGLELSATLRLADLAGSPWRLGLSAVIEEAGGHISYWAVAHPPGRPDFHHRDGFAVELPETGRS